MNARWVGLSLVLDEIDQVPRREAFKRAHPGTRFERIGDQCVGSVPYADRGMERSITVRGNSYKVVLDALEEYFAGPDAPDTG